MDELVKRLQADHPDLTFTVGEAHCWSPRHQQILYTPDPQAGSVEGLLHEVGHARLGHHTFATDVELLKKEVAAWEEAKLLAGRYGVALSEDHIQDCLDTYRDWLYRRSRCPTCQSTGVQHNAAEYSCLNCLAGWRVSGTRLRRPYRLQTAPRKK